MLHKLAIHCTDSVVARSSHLCMLFGLPFQVMLRKQNKHSTVWIIYKQLTVTLKALLGVTNVILYVNPVIGSD
jgi:heme A synthase